MFRKHFTALWQLIYPNTCLSCLRAISSSESLICHSCEVALPETNFHLQTPNPVEQLFWGRIPIESAASFYYFRKAGLVKNLIVHLKYKGVHELGEKLGRMYGYKLLEQKSIFQNIDLIIPLPLHWKREKQRGYNQSDSIAKGLSEVMNIPWSREMVIRSIENVSQTKKRRFERWSNVENIFELTDKSGLEGKHILLVDDVITTGATLEACATILLQAENVKVSIVTLTIAGR